MTQITGKIYQMKNAAGTENRFPRTVMEAVLGLNTYLQQQFSALADIYMPIEGISEALTDQEFVYRISPASIKAKSLTLDRILGRTLAWNQLAPKYPQATITSNGITWVIDGNGFVTGNGTATGISFSDGGAISSIHCYASHTYYFGASGPVLENRIVPQAFTNNGNRTLTVGVGNAPVDGDYSLRIRVSAGETLTNAKFFIYLVDLTLLYGSEIDGLTDAQILAKFESEFPGYHDFGNKLISNDAESLETTGFNLWDEEWEVGALNEYGVVMTNGYTTRRTTSFISVVPNTTYYQCCPSTAGSGRVVYYDENKKVVSQNIDRGLAANSTFVTPENAYYVRVTFGDSYGTTYNHDICINLSDPAKNGTYEPYRKTTLQLGLNNLKVKDGNGNITTITGGLKSAGSVRDEIVGNKYIKRVGEVDLGTLTWDYNNESVSHSVFKSDNLTLSKEYGAGTIANAISNRYAADYRVNVVQGTHNKVLSISGQTSVISGNRIVVSDNLYTDAAAFKTAVNGVMLYYELATPIEYELFEPIVYSMAAGTTEARISPNSDGLSAPFCCDMTYSANANNDSANAQYALTAGRLYNTHKIWGQDFDGSNDVSGALSGVTTIGASGNITTAAQLISTVATGTAPLSVASTTEVANLHSYTATKLHTQRTLWGQNFDGSGNVTGDMSSVGNIAFSASGKNIASLLYFDTTNSRVGVGASSPAYKLDVNGTLRASGNTTLGGTLDVIGNTAIRGTFTVGTSSVNKATTLYGALTASGAVSFSDTLTIAGLTTFNGNAILPANKTFTIGPSSGTHAVLEWDATNSCVKITGNLRVTGWIEQQGTQS